MNRTRLLPCTFVVLALACSRANEDDARLPTTSDASEPACDGIAVRVVDPEGRAVVGARVAPRLSAMVGPAGAFAVEGGQMRIFERSPRETDASGSACVPDERESIAELAREPSGGRPTSSVGSSSSPLVGVEVRFARLIVEVSHPSWQSAEFTLDAHTPAPSEALVIELQARQPDPD
jgi:hypothetical protein